MTQESPEESRPEYHFRKFMESIECDANSRSKILKFIDTEYLSNYTENER